MSSARPADAKTPVINTFIHTPAFDLFFFILQPLIALFIGYLAWGTAAVDSPVTFLGHTDAPLVYFYVVLMYAHLWMVFVRSHANKTVFNSFRWRFTLVPLLLFLAFSASQFFVAIVAVIATWWDVYHSGLQTFGLGRIYDAKRGNSAETGRRLDVSLNHLMYAGPILGGAVMFDHVSDTDLLSGHPNTLFFTQIPYYALGYAGIMTNVILAIAVPFVAYYLFAYYRLWQDGYAVSWQKVLLLVSTAITSVWAWGFNTFGEAFLIMNLFHAVQYFAIVYVTDRKNLANRLGLGRFAWGPMVAFALASALAIACGFYFQTLGASTLAVNIGLTVSIMHFWYDGFIWSVRKKMV